MLSPIEPVPSGVPLDEFDVRTVALGEEIGLYPLTEQRHHPFPASVIIAAVGYVPVKVLYAPFFKSK